MSRQNGTSFRMEFIEKIAQYAVAGMRRTNILASLCLAQACLESGYGSAATMMNNNAVFGIVAGSWTGKTFVCSRGIRYRAYDSLADSVADYFSLLSTASRYAGLVGEKDYKRACVKVRDAGYTGGADYPDKLIKIIETYDLTRYDKMAQQESSKENIMNFSKKNSFLNPLSKPYRETSPFGMRTLGGVRQMHNGIDLVPLDGRHPTQLLAAVDGTVADIETSVPDSETGLGAKRAKGNYVNIRTPDGWTYIYRHLKHGSIPVKKGQAVKAGDAIGVMGTTGQSTGVHLHYEIRNAQNEAVNPAMYLSGAGNTQPAAPAATLINSINIINSASGNAPAAPSATAPAQTKPPSSGGAFKVGDRVKVKASAAHYASGEPIPDWVKNKPDEIMQLGETSSNARNRDAVLLKNIYSWVKLSDVEKM